MTPDTSSYMVAAYVVVAVVLVAYVASLLSRARKVERELERGEGR